MDPLSYRTWRCKPKPHSLLVHSFSSPSFVRSHLILSLLFSSSSIPLSFSAKYIQPILVEKPSNLPYPEQGQQEHPCNTVLWCSESKRAPVGGPCARKKFGKSTMAEHVLRVNVSFPVKWLACYRIPQERNESSLRSKRSHQPPFQHFSFEIPSIKA